MTEKNLSNKVVIVTGAGGGLGRAMIAGLAKKGARLAAVDIDPVALEAIAKKAAELGGEGSVLPIVADVGRADFSDASLFRARFHRTGDEGAVFDSRTGALGDDEHLARAERFQPQH